jgi:hypothetical protein
MIEQQPEHKPLYYIGDHCKLTLLAKDQSGPSIDRLYGIAGHLDERNTLWIDRLAFDGDANVINVVLVEEFRPDLLVNTASFIVNAIAEADPNFTSIRVWTYGGACLAHLSLAGNRVNFSDVEPTVVIFFN